jgi:hypothetical protein
MNEVVARINEMNAESAAWVAEDPENRFAGELTNDPAHWAEYGITTVAELEAYFDACAEREAYKAMLAGDDWDCDDSWREEMFAVEAEVSAEELELLAAAGPYGEYENMSDPCYW